MISEKNGTNNFILYCIDFYEDNNQNNNTRSWDDGPQGNGQSAQYKVGESIKYIKSVNA